MIPLDHRHLSKTQLSIRGSFAWLSTLWPVVLPGTCAHGACNPSCNSVKKEAVRYYCWSCCSPEEGGEEEGREEEGGPEAQGA